LTTPELTSATNRDRFERRWVPLRAAAAASGLSVSTLRRWANNGRIEVRLDSEREAPGRLVDLDEVLTAQAAAAANGARGRGRGADEWRRAAFHLSTLAVVAERRAEEAETELARLQARARELETWLDGSARFDEVEHVQLGRLLALASAEREHRRLPLLVSIRAALLVLYGVAALTFAVLILTQRI
jgi:hypothetical protein